MLNCESKVPCTNFEHWIVNKWEKRWWYDKSITVPFPHQRPCSTRQKSATRIQYHPLTIDPRKSFRWMSPKTVLYTSRPFRQSDCTIKLLSLVWPGRDVNWWTTAWEVDTITRSRWDSNMNMRERTCVAQMTGLPILMHRPIIIFCARKTFSGGISIPRSPRATMIPSHASKISSILQTKHKPL